MTVNYEGLVCDRGGQSREWMSGAQVLPRLVEFGRIDDAVASTCRQWILNHVA
jgi:hypothetical protein